LVRERRSQPYLRRLLVVGATAVMRHVKDKPTPMAGWIRKPSEKKPFRIVSVALANKLARIAWVVLTRKEAYHPYAHLPEQIRSPEMIMAVDDERRSSQW
jgi:hypothetical protein